MNIRTIPYITTALLLAGATVSCERDDIYEELEFSVRLAPTNTYVVGEPVVFELVGNADFITVWNGDVGHEYSQRDRTLLPEELLAATLELDIQQQYGQPSLDIYMTDRFEGLQGRAYGDTNAHAESDRALIQQVIDSDFEGWERFEFEAKNEAKFHTFTTDILPYRDNFTLAFRIKTPGEGKQVRTYSINPRIITQFERHGTYTRKYADLEFIPFRMEGLWCDLTPYVYSSAEDLTNVYKVNQTGIVKFSNGLNPVAGSDIAFQSFKPGSAVNASVLPGVIYEAVDQWIVMKPLPLYTVDKDTGQNIKGLTDDIRSYEHSYTLPGTYTASFLVSKGNYQGESAREIREVTFTIINPIGK